MAEPSIKTTVVGSYPLPAWLAGMPSTPALRDAISKLPYGKQPSIVHLYDAPLPRTAIVRFALRQKTRLAALRVRDNVLVLQTMLWDDEVRKPEFDVLDSTPRISQKERDMAAQLVDSLSEDFDPSAFTDDYQEQLRTLIDAKIEQGASLDTEATFGKPEEEESADVVDLMEALKRSVDRKNASKKPAKKTTTKKPAAKKTAAKKTAAKKAPAKKSSRRAS